MSVTGLDGQSLAPVLTVCMFTISCGKNLEHWLIITFSITDDLELHLPQHVCPVQVSVGRLLQLGPVQLLVPGVDVGLLQLLLTGRQLVTVLVSPM